MSTPGSALVGYAILRANYNASAGNYLENFTPFVLAAIANSDSPIVERSAVAAAIREMFGLRIPSLVIPRLIRRANKDGITEPVGTDAVRLTGKALADLPDLSSEVEQYQRRQKELITCLASYIESHHPEHLELTTRDLGAHLAEFFDRQAVPLLGSSLGRKGSFEHADSGMEYVVASFVDYLSKNDQVRFSYVVEAAKGAMLASVLELDTSSMNESLASLTIILDTPVAMDVLGFHGETPCGAMTHVLEMARTQGAAISIFRHSVGELDGILESIEGGLRRGSSSRMTSAGYLHFAEVGSSPADLALIRGRLEDHLSEAGIAIAERPEGYRQFGLDEEELERKIQSRVHYFQDAARINDVHSLSAVHRMRRGDRSKSFEKCVSVMMTSNSNLVRGARDFKNESSFPLAVTAEAVASMLWVRSPALAPDVPREMVLASAYVGMQPSPTLWSKYVDEIERLERAGTVSADDAIVLRATRTGREALMLESLGDESVIESELPLVVLERVQGHIADPLRAQVGELESQLAASDAVATHASEDWVRQVDAREQAEQEAAVSKEEAIEFRARLRRIEQEERDKSARMRNDAHKRASKICGIVKWISRFIIVGASAAAIIAIFSAEDPSRGLPVIIVSLLGVIGFIFTFLPPMDVMLARLESRIALTGYRRRLRLSGQDPSQEGTASDVAN